MKIEIGPHNSILPLTNAKKSAATRPAEEAKSAKPGDNAFSVLLSKAAEKAAAPAQNDDEIRQARVAAIRDQLAAGTYNISGKDVANKILKALKG
jgi:flagellar biosynthesis anti-sigma factor FlgM